MSRYRGNRQRCPHCVITYKQFNTGLTYAMVFDMMKDYSDDPRNWKYKRRHTVLGYWHSVKKRMWKEHFGECKKAKDYDEVPF